MIKAEVRKIVKDYKKTITQEDVINKSADVISRLKELNVYKQSTNILCYVSYNNEVDTKEFISYAIDEGKNVYVPKVNGKDMEFFKINSLDELTEGSYGILEPTADYESMFKEENTENALMIMPGVAFDKYNNRAGYGGGFYDRFLEKHNNIYKVAICFDFQMFDYIETEEFDIKPDMVIVSE